jgi:hypothetical protein
VVLDRYGVELKQVTGIFMPRLCTSANHHNLVPPLVPSTMIEINQRWGRQWDTYWRPWQWGLPQPVWLPSFAREAFQRRPSGSEGHWFFPYQPDSHDTRHLWTQVCDWPQAMVQEVAEAYRAGTKLYTELKEPLRDFATLLKQARTVTQVAAVYAPTMAVLDAMAEQPKPPAIRLSEASLHRLKALSRNASPATELIPA